MQHIDSSRATVLLNTGRVMPVIGLGTWQLKNDTAGTIEQALALGYPMIDTSGDYGTQPGIGEGIRRANVSRGSFCLVTKVEEDDEDTFATTQKNLEELGLEYADLVLIHRPPPTGIGEALWEGLIRAQDEGLTKDIGVSNYSQDLIEALIEKTGIVPAVNQLEWSPFGFSEDMLQYARKRNIIIQAYSPLTRGKRLDDETLTAIGSRYGKTSAQVLLRWNIERGTVPLPKANQFEHLKENIDVFDFTLSDEDMDTLNNCNERYSSLGVLAYA